MEAENLKNKIAELTNDLLRKMGFEAQIESSLQSEKDNMITVSVSAPNDSGFLIGKKGMNLEALEHLLRVMIAKDISLPKVNLILDINEYRKTRTQHLVDAAKEAASRVATTARAEALYPMTSYERRLVHMELASHKDIETESIGEGPQRRIVIKPSSTLSF